MKRALFSFLCSFSFWSNPSFAQQTLFHCGTLIDGLQNNVVSQVTVVVNGNKIIRVEKDIRLLGSMTR